MKELKFIGIIPARYASTRFPGKPLAKLGGKYVIQRVYEQVSKVLPNVVVALDDERIAEAVSSFGGKWVMTRTDHKCGTDRCLEAYLKNRGEEDVIINIQGDEPFIQPSQLEAIMACFRDEATDIATLVKPFESTRPYSELENPNSPKVVVDANWNAKYFSRSVIPYVRNHEKEEWPACHQFTPTSACMPTRLMCSSASPAFHNRLLRWLKVLSSSDGLKMALPSRWE